MAIVARAWAGGGGGVRLAARWGVLLIAAAAGGPTHGQAGQTLTLGTPAHALYSVQRPQRRVAHFDFEERDDGNYEALPMGWHAIGRPALVVDPNFHRQPMHAEMATRPGFPAFNEVRFDRGRSASGEHSLLLGIDGGQAGAFLENGSIVVVPGADYLITARVSTAGLDRASARLGVFFIDAVGRRLPGEVWSEPIRDAVLATEDQGRDRQGWAWVSVRLTADDPAAARLGLTVELRQPRPASGGVLGKHEVVLQDVEGRAWFDDISVWQLPFVEVGTQSRSNVFVGAARPVVRAEVRDLTGRSLEARTRLYDHRLRPVAEERRGVGAGRPTRWTWEPQVPRFGWYLIDLEVFERAGPSQGRIARSIGGMLVLPDDRRLSPAERTRWGVLAEGESIERLGVVADIVSATGLGAATLSVWDESSTPLNDDERQEALDAVVQRLVGAGADVTMSMAPLPEALAEEAQDATDALSLIRADPAVWRPMLVPALTRHGQWVRGWQVGGWRGDDVFFYDDLPGRLGALSAILTTWVADPLTVLPWRIDQPAMGGLSSGYRFGVHVPTSVTPEAIGGYLDGWPDRAAVWLRLDVNPADRLPHDRRAADLALRLISAWSAEPGRVALASPWTRAVQREMALVPDPLLGVFVQTGKRLAGRRSAGELDLGPHLRATLFEGRDGATLAMWNRSAEGSPSVEMYLGERPVAIDVFGNRQAMPAIEGKHRVALGPTPIFIEGIDVPLAKLRASLSIDEPFLESEQSPQDRVVTFVNPWPRTVSGQVSFTEPADWRLQPRRQYFSVAAGGTVRLPIRVNFPASELAGEKQLIARLQLEADRPYDVELTVPMEVGLSDVDFDATVALEPGPGGAIDAVATCIVTNTGDRAWSMYSYATMPRHPRQSLPISQLEPGQTIVRRFRFRDGGRTLVDEPLRCGLRAINGPRMLNRRFTLADVQ
jgi:hypothetical protein